MVRLTTPLGSHSVLHTTDIDDARASIAASLAPHLLTVRGETNSFDTLHNAAGFDGFSLHYIDYGSEVEVLTERLGFCLVQIPLGGQAMVQAGRTVEIGRAHV